MMKLKEEKKMTKAIAPQESNLSLSDSMLNAFNTMQNKTEIAEILKELFMENKINMITDLTHDEIKLATRLYMISEMKDIKLYKDGLNYYLKLLLSKQRKSRREMIEAVKGYISEGGILSKLNPFNKNK